MKLGDLLPSQIGRRHRQRGPASSGDPAVSSILSLPAVSLPNRPALSLSKGSKSSSAADVLSPEPAEGSKGVPKRQERDDQQRHGRDGVRDGPLLVGVQMPRNGIGRNQLGKPHAHKSRNNDHTPPERHKAQEQQPTGPFRRPPDRTSRHASGRTQAPRRPIRRQSVRA